MLNINEVIETNKMIHEMNLDVRTITMGISLLDCVGDDVEQVCDNIHKKITSKAARWSRWATRLRESSASLW